VIPRPYACRSAPGGDGEGPARTRYAGNKPDGAAECPALSDPGSIPGASIVFAGVGNKKANGKG
jgi:hypothetical protein